MNISHSSVQYCCCPDVSAEASTGFVINGNAMYSRTPLPLVCFSRKWSTYNYAYDNAAGVAWNITKAVATTAFLLGGGEEMELAWNLGSMLVDAVIDYNKKE